MCTDGDHEHDHGAVEEAAPRPIAGDAVDPIALEPVDEITITTLCDNSYDGLLAGADGVQRASLLAAQPIEAFQFTDGETLPGLVAEHGFSALITVRRGDRSHTLLFDTGVSPYGLSGNMERLQLSAGDIEAVVLSHNHFDHAGGFTGLSKLRRRSGLPLIVHPGVWEPRRVAPPGMPEIPFPTLSRRALEGEGFDVVERRQPSLVLDGSVLITGEVDRTTDFETGMAFHEKFNGSTWEPDPLILDDQALIVHVRGKGLVVVTGCGHAGAVNICRYAMRLTGVDRLTALCGGLHLGGAMFEPVIEPTIHALSHLEPEAIVPAHCTGWKAQFRLAAELPDAFVPNSVGTRVTLAA